MNNMDQQNIEFKDEEQVQITDLDPVESPLRKHAANISSLLQKMVLRPWIRYSLVGSLLICLFGSFYLQYYWHLPAKPIISPTSAVTVTPIAGENIFNVQTANHRIFIQTANNVLTTYQVENGHALWRNQFPGRLAMSATDQILYCYFSTTETEGILEALNANNGKVIWKETLKGSIQKPSQSPNQIQVVGDTLYLNNTNGFIYAIQVSNGIIRWTFYSGNQGIPLFVFLSIHDGMVEIDEIMSQYRSFYILDAGTGRELFQLSNKADSQSFSLDSGLIYIFPAGGSQSIGQSIQVFRISDRHQLWERTLPDGTESIVEQDGVIFLTSGDGTTVSALRGIDGQTLWSYKTSDGMGLINFPYEVDGLVYIFQQDATLVCIRLSDGKNIWNDTFKEFNGQTNSIQPVFDNGVIFLYDSVQQSAADVSTTTIAYMVQASSGSIIQHIQMNPPGVLFVQSGMLYIMQSGILDAWRSGDYMHLWQIKAPSNTIIYGNLPGNTDTLLLGNQAGKVYFLQASSGRFLWSYPAK